MLIIIVILTGTNTIVVGLYVAITQYEQYIPVIDNYISL